MFLLPIIIGIAVIYVVVNFIKERQRLLSFSQKFRSPPIHPLMGNSLLFPKDPVDIFKTLMDFHKTYGKTHITWGPLNDVFIAVADPKDVETLLSGTRSIKKSREYTFLYDWLGTGLLVSDGKKWFTRRRIITPTFHFNILEQFIDVFNKQVDVLVEKLRPNVDGPDFDAYKYSTLCALDIICEASMGIEVNSQDNKNLKYVNAVKTMSLIIFKRIFSIVKQWPWMFALTKMSAEQKKMIQILHQFTDKVIETRRQQLNEILQSQQMTTKNTVPEENDTDIYFSKSGKKKLALLDLLLQATADGKPLSNSDIREEVDTFMFEGHDTTTSGISFTIFHLAEHQEIQQKCYEEIVALLGEDKKAPVTYNNLGEMKYLEMVIKESLRITPPVPLMGRELTEETVIGGVSVPAGTSVGISIYAMHQDPDTFPNPEIFDPERFSPEKSNDRNAYAYIPFSAGPRNCIGQKFAMLELKSTIAKLLLNYKILPSESNKGLRLQGDLVLKSQGGVNVRITNRY